MVWAEEVGYIFVDGKKGTFVMGGGDRGKEREGFKFSVK